jgi:hypothetical protein
MRAFAYAAKTTYSGFARGERERFFASAAWARQ